MFDFKAAPINISKLKVKVVLPTDFYVLTI